MSTLARLGRTVAGVNACLRLRPFDVNHPEGREKERHRRILLSSMASFTAKIIAIVALLITTPMTLGYLGAERFGLWMTVSSLIAMLGFADLGVGNGLLNIIAEANGRDDRDMARRAVTSSVVLLTTIGLVLVSGFAIAYPGLDWGRIYNIAEQRTITEAGEATFVLIACLAISIPLLTAQRVQSGYQEGFQANLWQALGSIFMLVGILLAVYFKAGLQWLVLAAAGGPATAMGLNWAYQFGINRRWLFPRLAYFEWKIGQRIISLGILWTWFQLMGFVSTAADNLVISHFFGAGAVGRYAIMSKLLSGLLVAQMFSAALWPAFAEAFERGDMDWIRKTFRRTLILFSAIGLVSALVMGFGSFWIVRVWVGPEMEPTPWMALGFAFWSFITNIFAAIAALMSNNRMIMRLTLLVSFASLTSFILKLVFARYFGIDWIIWATVLGWGLACIPGILIARGALRQQENSNLEAQIST